MQYLVILLLTKTKTELECTVQYTIMCLQSIVSVYLIIYTNIQLSTFYKPQEIQSLYIQCTMLNT